MSTSTPTSLIAVDIGNSRMKLGRFQSAGAADDALPEPTATFSLAIDHETGQFNVERFLDWCDREASASATWLIASVHREATERLSSAIGAWSTENRTGHPIRKLTYRDVPLAIRVDQPERVGIDRLLAALAADHLRDRNRAAIVIDLGTAITVDLLQQDGAFAGGAILPGIATSAKALADHTDALSDIELEELQQPPPALGKSTAAAIEAGLYWGAVGAVRELVARLSTNLDQPPELFLTGGASSYVAELLAQSGESKVNHVPHLVLSGIAMVKP